jgi:hypothetical protein
LLAEHYFFNNYKNIKDIYISYEKELYELLKCRNKKNVQNQIFINLLALNHKGKVDKYLDGLFSSLNDTDDWRNLQMH